MNIEESLAKLIFLVQMGEGLGEIGGSAAPSSHIIPLRFIMKKQKHQGNCLANFHSASAASRETEIVWYDLAVVIAPAFSAIPAPGNKSVR